jgi:dimethylhistidine N-methyltransferase
VTVTARSNTTRLICDNRPAVPTATGSRHQNRTFDIVNDALSADQQTMLDDVLAGLARAQKSIPPKYFYDQQGSLIFDEITELPEYYPTRAETQIMQRHGREIARTLGEHAVLVEYGSGSSTKTRILLDEMPQLSAYVPVDISGDHLQQVAGELQAEYPHVPIQPVVADFTQPFALPAAAAASPRRVVYFPGSTIGNFTPTEAIRILRQMANSCGGSGGVLIGVDLLKARPLLIAAYNDAQQVTARFNLNLLQRLNRELGADFELQQFRHQATFDETESRIEMHLFACSAMAVHIAGETFHFDAGESILTEYSHKYTLHSFADLAAQVGLQCVKVWTDPENLFSVQYLTVDSE